MNTWAVDKAKLYVDTPGIKQAHHKITFKQAELMTYTQVVVTPNWFNMKQVNNNPIANNQTSSWEKSSGIPHVFLHQMRFLSLY